VLAAIIGTTVAHGGERTLLGPALGFSPCRWLLSKFTKKAAHATVN
jgi:hypothetical protein